MYYSRLLNVLQAFSRAEDRMQDCVAFSLQELLKMFSVKASNRSTNKLWQRFPVDVQETLSPLLHSLYRINMSMNWAGLKLPIFAGRKGETFESWVCTFTCYIGSRLQNDRAARIFEACKGVLRHESQVSRFLLPYFAVQVKF